MERKKRKSKPWKLPNSKIGLGIAAISYVGIDYLREFAPWWHSWLQPTLWFALAVAALAKAPYYEHWVLEMRAVIPFLGSIIFMLAALLCEALSVRSVTAVLGLDWHNSTPPLPDTGQWLLLSLNERLPLWVVEVLRAHIISLHHYLMLFIMLAFSVLFDSVKAPGLGLGARYMFTMGVGRLLRAATFVSTILPSLRPWCATARFPVPSHPHPWAQKYYVPYAKSSDAIRRLIDADSLHAGNGQIFPKEYRPDWGRMSFLAEILRPTPGEGPAWYHLLKKASGGCNDLLYSGHMLVAVLTAMAWQEAYGGRTSALIWLLVLHSAQREVRERHHYTADCVVAIYVGVMLWRTTRFLWSAKEDAVGSSRAAKLEEVHPRLVRAAKDSDMDEVRAILEEISASGGSEEDTRRRFSQRALMAFGAFIIVFSLSCVLLAFSLTSDG